MILGRLRNNAGGSPLSNDTHPPHFWMLKVVLGRPWLSASRIPAARMPLVDGGLKLPAFAADRNVRLGLCQLPWGLPMKRKAHLLLVHVSPACSVQHPPGLQVRGHHHVAGSQRGWHLTSSLCVSGIVLGVCVGQMEMESCLQGAVTDVVIVPVTLY